MRAYCIFIDTVSEGRGPSVRDESNRPCLFETELSAQREIIDNAITRMHEFMNGERDFEDATTIEEYVVGVDVLSDGSIMDEFGSLVM
jgi:hypothetical protein